MGAGLRAGAKAPESPPDPNVGAPALDSTNRFNFLLSKTSFTSGFQVSGSPRVPAGYHYGAKLRIALLLRLADQYLYAPLWSAAIHSEWIGSVLEDRPYLTANVLERTRAMMDRHFPDAVVTGYSARIAGLHLPDADDLHVLAAAIEGGADMIVTRNLRDFPADRLAPHGLTAQHPDVFIADLFDADPEAVLAAVRGHRAALSNPPRTELDPGGWTGIVT